MKKMIKRSNRGGRLDAAIAEGEVRSSMPAGESSVVQMLRMITGDYEQDFSANGYCKLPGGLLIQWGSDYVPAKSSVRVTLSLPFEKIFFRKADVSSPFEETNTNFGHTIITQGVIENDNRPFLFHNDNNSGHGLRWMIVGR